MKRLAAMIMIFSLLTGCSSKSSPESSASSAETITVGQTIYQETELNFDDVFIPVELTKCGENYSFLYYNSENIFSLARLDSSFNVTDTIQLENSGAVYVHDDGGFTLLSSDTDFEFKINENGELLNYDEYINTAELNFKLTDFDASGSVIKETEINELDKYYDKECSRLTSILPYDENSYFLFFETGAAIIGKDGSLLDTQDFSDRSGMRALLDSDGKIIVTDRIGYTYIDHDNFDVPQNLNELSGVNTIYSASVGYGEFKAFIECGDGIYGLAENGSLVLVMDYQSSLLKETDIEMFIPCGDGEFLAFGKNKLKHYTRRPDDYVENRQRIDIWSIDRGGSYDFAVEFNKQSDNYIVNVTELVGYDELKNAILTGDAPDVIFLENMSYVKNLSNMGALVDMGELLDSGKGLTREEIMPNVIEALSSQGGIYTLPEYYRISVCAANKDYIGAEFWDWTLDDFYKFYSERPEGMYLTYDLMGKDPFITLCCENLGNWINFEKSECHFDSPEFVKFLEFFGKYPDMCPEYPEDSFEEYQLEEAGSLKEKRAMLCLNSGWNSSSIRGIIDNIGMGGLDGLNEATLLNFPDSSGKGQIELADCYSILEGSNCKEGAWEFISYVLGEEYLKRDEFEFTMGMGRFVSNKKAFDEAVESWTQKGDEPKKLTTTIGDTELEYTGSLTEEQAKSLRDFIENCTEIKYTDYSLDNIISEEYDRYIHGEITAQQCAEYIQSRANIYLSEQL